MLLLLVARPVAQLHARRQGEQPVKRPMKEPAMRRRRTNVVAMVAMVAALALAALRCSVNVPLGVDPHSDAADTQADAAAGN